MSRLALDAASGERVGGEAAEQAHRAAPEIEGVEVGRGATEVKRSLEGWVAARGAARKPEGKDVMGGDYRKLYDLVRSVSAPLRTDRPLADEIRRVMELLQSEAAQEQCLAPDCA